MRPKTFDRYTQTHSQKDKTALNNIPLKKKTCAIDIDMNWYGFNMPQFVSQSFEQPIHLFVKPHWKTSLTWSGWWSRFVFLSVAGRHAPPFVSFYFFFFLPFCDPIYSHLPGQVDMTVNRLFCRPHFFAEMRWQTPPVCHLAGVAKQHLKGRKLAAAAPRTRGEQNNNSWASKLGERSRWQQQNYWCFSGRGTNYVWKLLTKIITIFSTGLEETVMLVETTQLSIQKKRSEEEQQNGVSTLPLSSFIPATITFRKATRTPDDVTAIIISLFLPLTRIGDAHYGVNSYLSKHFSRAMCEIVLGFFFHSWASLYAWVNLTLKSRYRDVDIKNRYRYFQRQAASHESPAALSNTDVSARIPLVFLFHHVAKPRNLICIAPCQVPSSLKALDWKGENAFFESSKFCSMERHTGRSRTAD